MKTTATHGALTLLCLAASTVLLMPVPVAAQSAADHRLDPVDIRATRNSPPPRVDVSRSCPDYGQALQASLERNLRYLDTSAEMKVVFELKGNEVTAVKTQGISPSPCC